MNDTRYSRQERFAAIGTEGQQRISQARVLICGCGALGSVIAERLARAGVGHLRIVDRDWVELSNLQRQSLFTEEHARTSTPKVVAAAESIGAINSSVQVEPLVEDLSFRNFAELANGCQLIMDGTDNFETRFLINDYCVENGVPWIHGGCLGASGQAMTFVPELTACFRCLVPELPPREALETCDTAGVLGPAIGIVANWQAGEALKILSGNEPAVCKGLFVFDSWDSDCRVIRLPKNEECEACGQRNFPFLRGSIATSSKILCGKNAVQLESPSAQGESLAQIAERLSRLGTVVANPYFVRLKLPEHILTVFRGGRTIVEGTTDEAEAKTVLARTLGS